MTRYVTTLLFVYNDTTAQKKKSDEIEQLRHRSETIVQQNPMPIILVDMNFHITGCERGVCPLKRYRAQRVCSR